ncbi:uncharacterized protein [Littorina saxatilis]|uniref:uncharacterized protein n=1 Tax=Littorina saxatilis TaxID=31220 RepID=UPI0038B53083
MEISGKFLESVLELSTIEEVSAFEEGPFFNSTNQQSPPPTNVHVAPPPGAFPSLPNPGVSFEEPVYRAAVDPRRYARPREDSYPVGDHGAADRHFPAPMSGAPYGSDPVQRLLLPPVHPTVMQAYLNYMQDCRCGRPVVSEHSLVVSWNGTWAVYECPEGYRHQSGQLTRQCVNNTWTGQDPACTVDSVLPKAYLVMLIIGATLSVFVACIPYDFYRFRRRKKAARKHQERLSLMTRIAPGHAKMTETLPVPGALPNAQRRFGFRSLIKAFRLASLSLQVNVQTGIPGTMLLS